MDKLTVHYDRKPIYDIVFSDDFVILGEQLQEMNIANRRVCIVTESTVAGFYLDTLVQMLEPLAKTVTSFVFPAGEASKTLNTVESLYEHLILEKFDRKDLLIALGGGVVGDLTGYAAATYLRGIDFVQVPTSLLSQVDSSIGGKTGVDFNAYKNMVGAFYQPKLVYINLATLLSLTEREYLSGMGEIIKHGLIKDRGYYEWLKTNRDKIISRDLDTMKQMISVSCNIKRLVVENDPKEQGERALLNFGHTLGHAVERLVNFSLLHGECVAVGMAAAAALSQKAGKITTAELEDILATITTFKLPVKVSGVTAPDVLASSKSDKKMEAGKIKFVLLNSMGAAYIDRDVSDEMLLDAVAFIQEEV